MSDPIPEEFADHELLPLAKVFWQIDLVLGPEWGRSKLIWFDRTDDVFRVFNLPVNGLHYETKTLPEDGLIAFDVDESYQYAKDSFTTTVKVKVRDVKHNERLR